MSPDDREGAVLDASVALAWVIPDERSRDALELRDQATREGSPLVCPPTFWYEVANALWAAVIRNRMEYSEAQDALSALSDFGIESCDVHPAACLALSARCQIAVYDAAYLMAAIDRGVPLWSLDRRLVEVARTVGVKTLPSER